ncbi:hypothetical protein FS842_005915 [Serendipita sp. 407]|nr:hypothetical protein FS842_005915 [Serendipita sp. 407]
MDPTRSGGRLPIPGASASNTVQNSLSGTSAQSWHSARDPSNNSGPSDQSQAQSYPGAFPPGTFDSFLQPINSQSGLISSNNPNNSGPGGPDHSRVIKKRSRDDQEDLDPNVEAAAGKYGTSPQRLAELTAGFPTPPTTNNPPQLITTGRMTKTHADPLIAQLINPDGTPKRPMNAFMIFARKRRPEVAADNPNLRTGEISKLLSAEWKAIDNESKQFYLTKAKELKENFTSIFPTYVYKRRPNNSRKRRKTEDGNTYGGPGAMSAIDRGEGGLSEDDGDLSPAPGSMSPGMPHPLSGIPGLSGMGGHGGVRRPGDPTGLHMPSHHHHQSHGMVPPPPPQHDLPGPYNLHGSQYGGHHRGQTSPTVYYDPVSGGQSSSRGGGGALWPSLDAKREPKSPRMENNGQNSSGIRLPGVSTGGGGGQSASGHGQNAGSMRNGASTGSSNYGFSIPSPNFGPGPGLPPIGRQNQGSQGGSNPNSASQTPLLNSGTGGGGGGGGGSGGGGGGGSMLPPPPSSLYSNHGHGSSHSLNSGHGNHGHGHSGSYFGDSWGPSRTGQSPSSSSLNLNGPSSNPSSGSGAQGPDRQSSSRNRSDSLGGGPQSASSNSWNI